MKLSVLRLIIIIIIIILIVLLLVVEEVAAAVVVVVLWLSLFGHCDDLSNMIISLRAIKTS